MLRLLRCVAIAGLLLTTTDPLAAWNHRPARVSSAYYYTPSYYAPAYWYGPSYAYVPTYPVVQPPMVAVPMVEPAPYCPPPVGVAPAQPPVFAAPAPAPPSPGPVAPAQPRPAPSSTEPAQPGVKESASFQGGPVSRSAAYPPSDQCAVRFTNATVGPMILKVGGSTYPLAAGRGLTLTLPHRFRWQIDNRTEQTENVSLAQSTLDITLRR